MKSMQLKLLIAGVVVAGAVSYLAFAGAKQGWAYYLPVEQFVHEAKYHDQRVKLCGKVSPDHLSINRGQLVAKFILVGQGGQLPVVYHGAIPDMFRADGEAVVEGRLNPAGEFIADSLLTKCASKYDTDEGGQGRGHGAGGAKPVNHPKLEVPS